VHPACLPWRDSHPLVWCSIGTPVGARVQDATRYESIVRLVAAKVEPEIVRLSGREGLSAPLRGELQRHLRSYLGAVLGEEWP